MAGFSTGAFGDEQCSIEVGDLQFIVTSDLPFELASRAFDEDFDMPPYLFAKMDGYGDFVADFVIENLQIRCSGS
jgi:hypothetical protein